MKYWTVFVLQVLCVIALLPLFALLLLVAHWSADRDTKLKERVFEVCWRVICITGLYKGPQ